MPVKKKTTEKKTPKKQDTPKEFNSLPIIEKVKELIAKVLPEPMYDWLVGLDSPGPTPRDAAYYRLLFELAKEFKPEKMVDLGTCEGVSAMCMAKGNPEGRVYTIDRKDKLDQRCKQDNVSYLILDAIDNTKWVEENIGLLYIDIDHTPESMQKAFEIYAPCVVQGGIIVVDGVMWKGASDAMPAWWEGFNPEGYEKITEVGLHSLEGAGSGVFITL